MVSKNSDATRNRDAGNVGTELERLVPYAGDGLAQYVGRDLHCPARPDVAGDGDRIRIREISRVGVLRLHYGSRS